MLGGGGGGGDGDAMTWKGGTQSDIDVHIN
jgi:hypothetical protein